MRLQRWVGESIGCSILILAIATSAVAGDKVLRGTRSRTPEKPGENQVIHKCLTPDLDAALKLNEQLGLSMERERPWSLPRQALAEGQQATVNVLVLRYNFEYETTDDPNTTGRGRMDFSRPLDDSVDSAKYYDSVGHWIDPPPHNIAYFNAHLKALDMYWNRVSDGHINLNWHIYPEVSDSAYQLPYRMSHYGRCDSVVIGLEDYFEDAIRLADSAEPGIDFSQYQAIFLVHAGSDRQNDIGFPPTCSDLFTGFIKFGDSVAVDGGTHYVRTALMLPETSCQDNRATALNAVLAHEFGHQLGLVDLYSTRTFMSQLGDFSLMDDNGFGTGVDFGFKVGQVFGTIPVYPDAWSRAYLGYVPVVDFRQGTNIRVVAAEVLSSGIKIARVPISENEYYLIENRTQEIDTLPTALLADSQTNVIQGPVNFNRQFTGEYDNLLPGSGMLIYLVDEGVAVQDFDGDGENNFEDNDLQNNPSRRFITLMEADGIVNFGGYYRSGFGTAEDMFRDDRNHSFTPNTNPPAIDNSGNNTHVYITGITRDTIRPTSAKPYLTDTVMTFDLETENLAQGFPARVGSPTYAFSPVAADLNGDGADEVLVVSGKRLSAVTSDGRNFLRDVADTCDACPRYGDSAKATVHPGRVYLLPVLYYAGGTITANPVVGQLAGDTLRLTAVGYSDAQGGIVALVAPFDQDKNGLGDVYGDYLFTTGAPIAMTLAGNLWVLTDRGKLYRQDSVFHAPADTFTINDANFNGLSRLGRSVVVSGGDSNETVLYFVSDTAYSFPTGGFYNWGPVTVDVDRDGTPEIVVASPDGNLLYVSVDTASVVPQFRVHTQVRTGFRFTTNPIAGDVDNDGYADVIIGGKNAVYAFDQHGQLKTDFPIEVNDRFPHDSVIAAPIQAKIAQEHISELVFPTGEGNLYSFGPGRTYGFPLSAGELGIGSPVIFHDSTGSKLGYQGLDGWFYAWTITTDTSKNYWPMAGQEASGSFTLPTKKLGELQHAAEKFREDQFYNYPNPVIAGNTRFRYTLGEVASKVTITVFDLSGKEIASMAGTRYEGANDVSWPCGSVTPGVYRCRLKVDFSGDTKTAFTDVAIIR